MGKLFISAFNEELRVAATRASQIAIHYHHNRIDLAHFILALIEVPCSAINRLSSGGDPGFHNTRNRVRVFLNAQPKQRLKKLNVEGLSTSARLDVIIKQAQLLAKRRGARLISIKILFLALATEDFYSELERGDVGTRLLSPMGMTPCQIERILFDRPDRRQIGRSDQPIS